MRGKIFLIAALARNRVIGAGNRLPWHLPEDLKYFRRITQGHPVVMGRKTYESIGRLLPGRENRIVTRQAGYAVEGARIFGSLEEACKSAVDLFVIGGAEIYRESLKFADRLYLTEIDREVAGDATFPEWPAQTFREISRETHPPEGARDFGFSFVVYERV